jgi:hypothetical protein
MSDGATPESAAIRHSAWAIVGVALALALAGWVSVSLRFSLGVLIGGAIAWANFVALARIGRGMSSGSGGLWALLYLLKIGALFVGVFLVLRAGVASGVGIVLGLVALAPGIVIGTLLGR